MKYIRTSDKIFENKMNMLFADRKQADTIEELCDYWDFYFVSDDEYLVRSAKNYTIKQIRDMLSEEYIKDVKLAIRTGKGLIYVAKMNEKGELELI